MKLKDKKVLVVGLGKSGLSSALFLKRHGANVVVNDIKDEVNFQREKELLREKGIDYVFGRHPEEIFLSQDLIVVSPGVPTNIEPFSKASDKGIEIIGELELAYRFISTPIIAITGTNGKTTTTTLLGEILKKAGIKVFVGGNIGTPLIEYADDDSADLVVLEVSSFQLETISHFHPYGGIVLNITPDHLDRYNSMEEYAETKMRLFERQETFDFAVLNADDEWIMRYKPAILSDIFLFSTKKEISKGAYFKNGKIYINHPALKEQVEIDEREIKLKGIHNMENVMACAISAIEVGVNIDTIKEVLANFEGLHHRVEFVEEINGVSFYNDSKGTNVGAVERALAGFDKPVILILGGRDKGGGYSFLIDQIKRIVKHVVAIGEAKDNIYNDLHKYVTVERVNSFEEAVYKAYKRAEKGDIVLLSPACSSFDMFSSYTERGERFVQLVKKIKAEIDGKN
ncbi:MAG: UDP-N-acetylmuramoyl-L-alanine--D-glutamate ligase [Proteobacteria bacterium]|nr:UDP-N-acetylmuramoyl-L-alanine--D-glutamate ligase [Pseudomonadota bacterium]